jgi:hypothetical protein
MHLPCGPWDGRVVLTGWAIGDRTAIIFRLFFGPLGAITRHGIFKILLFAICHSPLPMAYLGNTHWPTHRHTVHTEAHTAISLCVLSASALVCLVVPVCSQCWLLASGASVPLIAAVTL